MSVMLAASALGCQSEPEPAQQLGFLGNAKAATGWEAVGLLDGGQSYCTATLIHPEVIITAAHCSAIGSVDFMVDGPQGRDSVRVDRFVTHPNHTDIEAAGPTDIAIGFLRRALDGRPTYGLSQQASLVGKRPAYAVGLGEGVDQPGRVKRAGAMTAEDSEEGWIWSWFEAPTEDALLCAGDSGGPLLQIDPDGALRIRGIASGHSCNGTFARSGFANVAAVYPWIAQVLRDELGAVPPDGSALMADPRVFHPALYRALSPELSGKLGLNEDQHAIVSWMADGFQLGLRGSPIYDPAFYTAGGQPPMARARTFIAQLGVSGRAGSTEFDPMFYATQELGPGTDPASAVQHFVTTGFDEGRRGSAAFSPMAYLDRYPAVAAATGGDSALTMAHWITLGQPSGWDGSAP